MLVPCVKIYFVLPMILLAISALKNLMLHSTIHTIGPICALIHRALTSLPVLPVSETKDALPNWLVPYILCLSRSSVVTQLQSILSDLSLSMTVMIAL